MSDRPPRGPGWSTLLGGEEFRAADEARFENAVVSLLCRALRTPAATKGRMYDLDRDATGRGILTAAAANQLLDLPVWLRIRRHAGIDKTLTVPVLLGGLERSAPGQEWLELQETVPDDRAAALVLFWPRIRPRGVDKDGGVVIHNWRPSSAGDDAATSLSTTIGGHAVRLELWDDLAARLG